jgi:hypothetical protein
VRAALAGALARRQGTDRLLLESIGELLAGLGWDVLAGAMLPTAAVVLSAAFRGAHARPFGEVFLRLALPYAGIAVLLAFGFQLLVPGFVVALGALLCLDPVARAEESGAVLGLPSAARVLPLLGLATVWLALASLWTTAQMFAVQSWPAPVAIAGGFVWQIVHFCGFLAWCEVLRRFPRETVPAG